MFILFIDFFLQEKNSKFLRHKAAFESICCLLSKKCVELKDESTTSFIFPTCWKMKVLDESWKIKFLCCEVLSQQWRNDTFDPLQLEGEMKMWALLSHKGSDLPQNFVSYKSKCDRQMFPTLYKALRIAATFTNHDSYSRQIFFDSSSLENVSP